MRNTFLKRGQGDIFVGQHHLEKEAFHVNLLSWNYLLFCGFADEFPE